MNAKVIPTIKIILLILLALFLVEKYVTGKLYYYIGPRFSWLTLLAIGLLIALAVATFFGQRAEKTGEAHEHHHDHEHDHAHEHAAPSRLPQIAVGALLLLGVIIPARPLGASAITSRGVSTDVTLASDQESRLTIVPSERNILDWARIISTTTNPAALNGQEADVLGFVYRDPRFAENQFMVARFTLTCCVADALAIGIVVVDENAAQLESDTWVQVRGTFAAGELDGEAMPMLTAAEITPVEAPAQPYLYP